jgi:CheY-like chemotaxis protein
VEVTGRSTLNGIRVLVAEDHGDTADLMRTVLQGQGAVVYIVGSIAAALAALADSDFDVLISDIGMPDGTGYDLMARVRDRERMSGRTAPAVAVTASPAPTTASGRWPPGFKAGRPPTIRCTSNRWPRRRDPARASLTALHPIRSTSMLPWPLT